MAKDFGIEIEYSQVDLYQRNLLKAQNHFAEFERTFLNTLANMIIQKAIPRTPVATGRLRRSWKVTKVVTIGGTTSITVYNDARTDGAGESYASFVELGHFTRSRLRWIEGRWMLTLSTDEVKAEMQRVWDMLFSKWVKGMGL